MRRYIVNMLGTTKEIMGVDAEGACDQMKELLGYPKSKVICSHTVEMFNGIEDLHDRCKAVSGYNFIDVAQLWVGAEALYLEITRADGYYDRIHFEHDQKELAWQVYNELKGYNRQPTPLEKFHASF